MTPDLSFEALYALALADLGKTRLDRAVEMARDINPRAEAVLWDPQTGPCYRLLQDADKRDAAKIATRQRNDIAAHRLRLNREFQENQLLERAYGSAAA